MAILPRNSVAAGRPDLRPSAADCVVLGSRRVGGGLATGGLYPAFGLGFVVCWGCIGAPWGCICGHWGCISGHWDWFRGLLRVHMRPLWLYIRPMVVYIRSLGLVSWPAGGANAPTVSVCPSTGLLYPVIGSGFVVCWGDIGAHLGVYIRFMGIWFRDLWVCVCVDRVCISVHRVWFRGLLGCICSHWGCISGHWVWFRGLLRMSFCGWWGSPWP